MAETRTRFELVRDGANFHHNKVGYTKVSSQFAEVVDNRFQQRRGNSYFDGTTAVFAQERDILK